MKIVKLPLLLAIFFCSQFQMCKKDDSSSSAGGSGPNGGGGTTCNYTTFSGSVSCSLGFVPVSASICCPESAPYYCANVNKCYSTCANAAAVCGSNIVKAGSSSTGGGGGGGGTTCSFTTYSGSGNCSNGVPVTSSLCCPTSSPYYCANTNKCYSSCSDAAANCGNSVIKAGTNSGGGGGSGGTTCTWNKDFLQIISAPLIAANTAGSICGSKNYLKVTFRNVSSYRVKWCVGIERPDGTYDTGGAYLNPGQETFYWGCGTTGRYKWNAAIDNGTTLCPCPF